MYTHTRTTFAQYPFIPARTSLEEFLDLYGRHVEDRPMFRTQDLERHVLAIDLRRFDLDILEDAFEGVRLSSSFAVLEVELGDVLEQLVDEYGDPTCWDVEPRQMPALITRAELS